MVLTRAAPDRSHGDISGRDSQSTPKSAPDEVYARKSLAKAGEKRGGVMSPRLRRAFDHRLEGLGRFRSVRRRASERIKEFDRRKNRGLYSGMSKGGVEGTSGRM
ncbi:hypothetical protein AAMO2058_001511400 [Amorphochlora amoebiformis]